MKDIYEATQLSGEEELEVSTKSSPTRPFLDQRSEYLWSCFFFFFFFFPRFADQGGSIH
jgi:hypothetical protein